MPNPEVGHAEDEHFRTLRPRPAGAPHVSLLPQPAEVSTNRPGALAITAPPVPRTSFVGRGAELERLTQLLAESRLLTLLGPGGIGKTRLAIHLAADVAERFPDGCFFVDLAPLGRGGPILGRVAESVGVEESEGGEPLAESLCRRLAASRR